MVKGDSHAYWLVLALFLCGGLAACAAATPAPLPSLNLDRSHRLTEPAPSEFVDHAFSDTLFAGKFVGDAFSMTRSLQGRDIKSEERNGD